MKHYSIKSVTILLIVMLSSCDNEETPKTLPVVETSMPTGVTFTTATTGGTIVNNGNDAITKRGIVFSSNVPVPTIADNKVESTVAGNDFTVDLQNLSSGTTYHVRAFATNSVGTAYGEVVDLTTGNAAPMVNNVTVTGTFEVGKTLMASYEYDDAENNAEGATTFQWYAAENASGEGETSIPGATERSFVVDDAQNGKFIRVSVSPKATVGTVDGVTVKSSYTTAIGAETVTFTYNGSTVTYGTIKSATTQRKWLDRNLGASRVAQSLTDYAAYGDLFQWGRSADGHQIIDRTDGTDNAIGRTGITSLVEPYETSDADIASTNKFIIVVDGIRDWRAPQNANLWQGVNGINNPCPSGWRIATLAEWDAEGLLSANDGFDKLKMTYTGRRLNDAGQFSSTSVSALYWTSDVFSSNGGEDRSWYVRIGSSGYSSYHNSRAIGSPCRCIKN